MEMWIYLGMHSVNRQRWVVSFTPWLLYPSAKSLQ